MTHRWPRDKNVVLLAVCGEFGQALHKRSRSQLQLAKIGIHAVLKRIESRIKHLDRYANTFVYHWSVSHSAESKFLKVVVSCHCSQLEMVNG